MGCPGLEPGTNRLKAEYSTIELATLAFVFVGLIFVFQLDYSTTNIYRFVKGLTENLLEKICGEFNRS